MHTKDPKVRAFTLALVAMALAAMSVMPTAQAGTTIDTELVKGGLDAPAAFTFLPSGKIIYLERGTGEVRIINPSTGSDRRFFTINGVDGGGERGALGVAVHPKWPEEPFVYVYVTRQSQGKLKNQIVRIRSESGHGVAMSVLVSTPASSLPYHNGGRIEFGPKGRLFAIVGDGHNSSNAQDRTKNLRGKILRMRADGGVPWDNPKVGGKRTLVYAYGIRNSFGFTFDPDTDRLWETENGPTCNDEINLIRPSRNYGWGPNESCPNTNQDGPNIQQPKFNYAGTIGITGAVFCDGCGLGFEGDLFYGACCDGGSLHRAVLNGGRDDIVGTPISVLDAPGSAIYSMEAAPDGQIYFSDGSAIYRLVSTT
ncbi:MAG TPA: PQQ-dependent sugar dehydrogenase [Actinomycetota bacterium]